MIDLAVPFPATDQWKARVSLRWATEPDVHHHQNIPLRRWAIQSKKGSFGKGQRNVIVVRETWARVGLFSGIVGVESCSWAD